MGSTLNTVFTQVSFPQQQFNISSGARFKEDDICGQLNFHTRFKTVHFDSHKIISITESASLIFKIFLACALKFILKLNADQPPVTPNHVACASRFSKQPLDK